MLNELFKGPEMPKAFLFDMDHTLIDNDCDVSWKSFLVEKGIAPKDALERADFYFEQYKRNELDTNEFLSFQLAEFDGCTLEEMEALAYEHFKAWVEPKMYEKAKELMEAVIATGCPVAMLTATNKTLATPVAAAFGINEVLACSVKFVDGKFHAELADMHSCGDAKVIYAKEFCAENNLKLEEIAYFGDSVSDYAILNAVGYPVATNPVEGLQQIAKDEEWPILNF